MDKNADENKIINCPLCKSNDYENIKDIKIDDLILMWESRRGFNPISNIYNGKILNRRRCNECGLYYYNYHLPYSKEMYEKLETVSGYYPTFRPTYKIVYDILLQLKPQSLFEIGSGNGCFIEYIKNVVPITICSEYNEVAVAICKEKNLNVYSQPINEINETFDVVCHHEVLEHVFNTRDFIKDNIRLLKKGGKLIIATPDPESILAINGNGEFNLPPHHQFDFSKKTFEWLANEFDLKIYDYKKTDVEIRQYEKYIILTNEKISYDECNKKFTGHSHVVVFEKL